MQRNIIMKTLFSVRKSQLTVQRCHMCCLTRQNAAACFTKHQDNWSPRSYLYTNKRTKSNAPALEFQRLVTPISEMNRFRQWTGVHKFLDKAAVRTVMLRMYSCCAELWDYDQFVKELDMEDSFATWASLTILHMWLIAVRITRPGEELNYNLKSYKECFGNLFNQDMEGRLKALGSDRVPSTLRGDAMDVYLGQFQHGLIQMDEGLLSDDKCLAGAIWRCVFNKNDHKEPEHLALMVEYVRKQVQHLGNMPSEEILGKGCVTFVGLKDNVPDTLKAMRIWVKVPTGIVQKKDKL